MIDYSVASSGQFFPPNPKGPGGPRGRPVSNCLYSSICSGVRIFCKCFSTTILYSCNSFAVANLARRRSFRAFSIIIRRLIRASSIIGRMFSSCSSLSSRRSFRSDSIRPFSPSTNFGFPKPRFGRKPLR